jgi:FAD/FMN-containing dehydrogenase
MMAARRPDPAWFEAARSILGEDGLATDAETLAAYGRDWTKEHTPAPSAVAFPRSTEAASRLLALCNQACVAVVPSGGRTGLAGGAVAAAGEVVVSLERMRRMDPVDPVARTVRVQAGAVTAAVHAHCAQSGLTWPVDFASSGSSQIGGNIATNAGGVRVVRYGLTRQWVIGLQVVLMSGEVLELNGALEKNNTGVDLRQLFIGSEGVLGVVTEATLKLAPLPGESRVALLAVPDLAGALAVFAAARRAAGFELCAFEYFTDACLDAVLAETGGAAPLAQRSPAYVLVELEPPPGAAGAEDRWLEGLFEAALVADGVLAESTAQGRALWSLRERISETLSKRGFLHKNDVSVPVSRLAAFTADMQEAFQTRYPSFEIYLFGHVGDGNLHVNVMQPPHLDRAAFLATCEATDALLFELIQRHGGSISAEHGIGLLKKPFLHYSRTAAELRLFRGLKAVLDPRGLLNPGKIFDLHEGEAP